MIQVNHVSKAFDGFCALADLNIHVPKGAVYGLVGPNGAGKSTIIRHLTGVYRPDSGEILIDGQPVYENTDIKSRIAYIPDDVYYYPQANIQDMMRFYRGIYPHFDSKMFENLGSIFKLDEKRPIRRFSKGMQKQAAFWLAISTRPDVLILDEPVDGLDPVMRRQVWSLILEDVAARGTTVLVSSHNLRELEDVCDHVGVMHEGKMMLEHSLSELQENIVKVQFVPQDETRPLPEALEVIHKSVSGRIQTLIIRGKQEEITNILEAEAPLFYDLVPLTLEEIFIYELGGADYAVKSVVL